MEKDYRVRAILDFPPEHEGTAIGLENHAKNQLPKTVGINVGEPNQELCFVTLEEKEYGSKVAFDCNFPPEEADTATGLTRHAKNQMYKAFNPSKENKGFVELERCGHRIKEPCKITKKYYVE